MFRALGTIVFLCVAPAMAMAQSGSNVKSGVNGMSDSMFGSNIDVVNGISRNGVPFQLLPGSSMTNGAGNSAMTPNIAGNYGSIIQKPTLVINGQSFAPPAEQ